MYNFSRNNLFIWWCC